MRCGLSLAFLLVDGGGCEAWTNLVGLLQCGVQIGASDSVAPIEQHGSSKIVATPCQRRLRGLAGEADCQLGIAKRGFEVAVALVRRRDLRGQVDARGEVEASGYGRQRDDRDNNAVR